MQSDPHEEQSLPDRISPKQVRYIKLGDGGRWARKAIDNGYLAFGYHSIPDEVCARCAGRNWDEVWNLLSDRRSHGAQTAGVTEVRTFYEMGEDCLWITFADGYLWWAFSSPDVKWVWDGQSDGPSRIRQTIGGWRNTDIYGNQLRTANLSSKLTQTGNYRATICKVAEKGYLLRRMNGIEEPVVTRAKDARQTMITVAVDMIQGLHWKDFETLTDLIFARSGWQRSTRVGETLADIDIVMEQPTTGETAFVQVKSKAGQSVLEDYLARFRRTGYDRFFFVCHSAQGTLSLPSELRLHLFEGERLADAAVKNGLFDWLIERSD